MIDDNNPYQKNLSPEEAESSDLEPWELVYGEFPKDSFHAITSAPYRLWFEHLRISPSYRLAHKFITAESGGLTLNDELDLPNDFNEVIKTYNCFGDVYSFPFRKWWFDKGIYIFGIPKHPYLPKILKQVSKDDIDSEERNSYIRNGTREIDRYFRKASRYSEHPPYLVMAIPLTGSRAEILKNIGEELKADIDFQFNTPNVNTNFRVNEPKEANQGNQFNDHKETDHPIYKLLGERFRQDTLTTGLRLLWTKLTNQHLTLWQTGLLAKVSDAYPNLKLDDYMDSSNQADSKKNMASMTVTMFNKTLSMVEESARGRFPSKSQGNTKALLPRFETKELIDRMNFQRSRDVNFYAKLQKKIRSPNVPSSKLEENKPLYTDYADLFDLEDIKSRKRWEEYRIKREKDPKYIEMQRLRRERHNDDKKD